MIDKETAKAVKKISVDILKELCEEKKILWRSEFLNENDHNVFNTVLLLLPIEFEKRMERIG